MKRFFHVGLMAIMVCAFIMATSGIANAASGKEIMPLAVDKCSATISKSGTTVTVGGSASFSSKEKSSTMYIELQQYKNGKWVYYKKMSPNKTASNSYSIGASASFSVDKGYQYRAYVKATASTTRSAYSSTVTVN